MKTTTNKLKTISAPQCKLGEGPLWCSERNCLYYLDILGKKLYCAEWTTRNVTTMNLPQMAGCVCMTENGSLVFAMEDGIYSDKWDLLNKKEPIPGIRFNDGKPGPDGRLYTGTIRKEGGGRFFCMGRDGRLCTLLDDVRISNGLDWSIDEKKMYYCDTATHEIREFEYDKKTGNIQNGKTVISFSESMGNPDGLCIDTHGMLWIALWGGGRVIRVDPFSAKVLESIEFPVRNVSCPAFAGENLDELVVTTAIDSANISNEPLAGYTFVIKTEYKGRQPYRFQL